MLWIVAASGLGTYSLPGLAGERSHVHLVAIEDIFSWDGAEYAETIRACMEAGADEIILPADEIIHLPGCIELSNQ